MTFLNPGCSPGSVKDLDPLHALQAKFKSKVQDSKLEKKYIWKEKAKGSKKFSTKGNKITVDIISN